jgi:hypothetical protein
LHAHCKELAAHGDDLCAACRTAFVHLHLTCTACGSEMAMPPRLLDDMTESIGMRLQSAGLDMRSLVTVAGALCSLYVKGVNHGWGDEAARGAICDVRKAIDVWLAAALTSRGRDRQVS